MPYAPHLLIFHLLPPVSSHHHLLTTFLSHLLFVSFPCHSPCHPIFLCSLALLVALPLSPLISESDHYFILLYCNLKPNSVSTPSNTISSQSGIRVKAMPGGVGINLSPYHSCFLLLLACLIKLPPPQPCTHKPISQSTSLYTSLFPPGLSSSHVLKLAPSALFFFQFLTDCVKKKTTYKAAVQLATKCV